MKKLTLSVAALTILIAGCTTLKIDNSETINTAEDVIGWIVEDVANGYIDSVKADSYIDNLEQMIKELE